MRRAAIAAAIVLATLATPGRLVHAQAPAAHATPATLAVAKADADLQAAENQAAALQQQLGSAQVQVAQLQQRQNQLMGKIGEAQAQEAVMDRRLRDYEAQEAQLRLGLARIAREEYERNGSELVWLLGSNSLSQLWTRLAQADLVAESQRRTLNEFESFQARDAGMRAELDRTLADVQLEDAEAATLATLIQQHEQDLQNGLARVRHQVAAAEAALGEAVLQEAVAGRGTPTGAVGAVYAAVRGGGFGIDTDLRLIPQVDAGALDALFAGTPLAGLGGVFVGAGDQNLVNPLYLVAHAIEESAFGSSTIAQQKKNLFGIGAFDSNPGGDALAFASFQACIQYEARFVSQEYLSPGGPFYHGLTLRGMNVDYASDPRWASKIASIYLTLPGGARPLTGPATG
ncbi:MAG: glucosaminidase domain-containing protein [Candidatus Dormibacteraeota bacterium]|nr:glucosaminidase domain-containing protein [Candidatus Dormibacteraeota bacterium]